MCGDLARALASSSSSGRGNGGAGSAETPPSSKRLPPASLAHFLRQKSAAEGGTGRKEGRSPTTTTEPPRPARDEPRWVMTTPLPRRGCNTAPRPVPPANRPGAAPGLHPPTNLAPKKGALPGAQTAGQEPFASPPPPPRQRRNLAWRRGRALPRRSARSAGGIREGAERRPKKDPGCRPASQPL